MGNKYCSAAPTSAAATRPPASRQLGAARPSPAAPQAHLGPPDASFHLLPQQERPRRRRRDPPSPSHFSGGKQPALKPRPFIALHLKTELKNKINGCHQGEDEERLW